MRGSGCCECDGETVLVGAKEGKQAQTSPPPWSETASPSSGLISPNPLRWQPGPLHVNLTFCTVMILAAGLISNSSSNSYFTILPDPMKICGALYHQDGATQLRLSDSRPEVRHNPPVSFKSLGVHWGAHYSARAGEYRTRAVPASFSSSVLGPPAAAAGTTHPWPRASALGDDTSTSNGSAQHSTAQHASIASCKTYRACSAQSSRWSPVFREFSG